MSGKDEKVFFCRQQGHKHVWPASDYVIDAETSQALANCPICDTPADEVSWRYLNLQKAWSNATGPRTAAGKARSRLNGYKTGEHSKSFPILAPALPGRYPSCTDCEYRNPCESEPYKWCPVLIQPMIHFVKAFQEGNVDMMKQFAGINQARIFQIVQMMYMDIQKHGVLVEETEETKNGFRTQFKANPLLSRIPHYIEMLGHHADQQSMTPRQQQETETARGFLEAENAKVANIADYVERQKSSMHQLKLQIQKASIRAAQDPALKRYTKEIEFEEVKDDEKPNDQTGQSG